MTQRGDLATETLPLTLARLREFDTIIDVRSPAEYAEDHLPGACSFPVLDDAQRAQVGTLHKEASAFAAKRLGGALIARNIAAHLETAFAGHAKSWKPLVYCWRGGMRSGAMTHVLRSVGWAARQLTGGYKAWRTQVIADLAAWPDRFDFRVICGRTGSGKSRLLEALEEAGRQVLDLERLAAHKGSVLGDLPDCPQPAQRAFETAIWTALAGFDPGRPVYVEAESKRIGTLRVPQELMQRMRQSRCIELVASEAARVALLKDDYLHLMRDPAQLFSKLDCLRPLHSSERVEQWMDQARRGDWDRFVAGMLTEHYDPAYGKSMFKNYAQAGSAQRLVLAGLERRDFAELAAALPA